MLLFRIFVIPFKIYKNNNIMAAPLPVGFVGNSRGYTQLISWLKREKIPKQKLTYKSFIVVVGPSGIGKTIGVEEAIRETNKYMVKIDCNNCVNNKEFKDILVKAISSDLLSQFEEGAAAERVIVIDELDALLSLDRTFINALCSLIDSNTLPDIKIIITYNLQDYKSLSNFEIILLHKPDDADILIYMRGKYPNIQCDILLETIEKCDGNISSIIMKIEGYESTKINSVPEVCNLYNDLPKDKIRLILDQDAWLHPLRFHENIINEFNIRKGLQKNKEQCYIKILKSLCEWDRMMYFYKGRVNDVLIPLEYVTSLVILLYTFPIKKKDVIHQDNFTKLFNYLSLRKKNMISLHSGVFPWENIGNIHKLPFDEKKKKKSKKFST